MCGIIECYWYAWNYFVYKKALKKTFNLCFWLQNNVIELTTIKYKFKMLFCAGQHVLKMILKIRVYKNKSETELVWLIQLIHI